MPSLDDVNNFVRTMVRSALAMPNGSVRPANPTSGVAAPAGAKEDQFATVLITEINSHGWDSVSYADEPETANLIETVQGARNFTASIQFFRGNAFDQAETLRRRLQMSDMIAACNAAGIVVTKFGKARNLSTVIDTFYEPRGQIDIDLSLIAQQTMSIATFNTFPFTVEGSDGLTVTGEVILS